MLTIGCSHIWIPTWVTGGSILEETQLFARIGIHALELAFGDFIGYQQSNLSRYVRLTSDRPSQRGWLFSRVPMTATNWQVRTYNFPIGHVQLLTFSRSKWSLRSTASAIFLETASRCG